MLPAVLGIMPLPDSISASALAAPSAPIIHNMVKPRRASTEAARCGAGSGSASTAQKCGRSGPREGVRGDNTVFSPWDPLSLVRSKKQAGSGLEHQGIALAFLRMTKPCAVLLVSFLS